MKKRMTAAVLMFALFLTSSYAASTYKKSIEVEYGITLSINGQTPTLTDAKGTTVQPFVYNGTTYVPIRAVADYLGTTISYNGEKNSASITATSATNNVSSISSDDIDILSLFKNMQAVADAYISIASSFRGISNSIISNVSYASLWDSTQSLLSSTKTYVSTLKSTAASLSSAMPEGMYEDISESFVLFDDCANTSNLCINILTKQLSDPYNKTIFDDFHTSVNLLQESAMFLGNEANENFNTWCDMIKS